MSEKSASTGVRTSVGILLGSGWCLLSVTEWPTRETEFTLLNRIFFHPCTKMYRAVRINQKTSHIFRFFQCKVLNIDWAVGSYLFVAYTRQSLSITDRLFHQSVCNEMSSVLCGNVVCCILFFTRHAVTLIHHIFCPSLNIVCVSHLCHMFSDEIFNLYGCKVAL